MTVELYKDYQSLSESVAEELYARLKDKPRLVLCLASGDTPKLSYQLLVQRMEQEKNSPTDATLIGLDEWMGIPRETPGTCYDFFKTVVLDKLFFKEGNSRFFNPLAKDPDAECRAMDKYIRHKGGIDLMIVGLGMNGHIGFNEPGVAFDLYSHVTDLDTVTQTVGQKYFQQHTSLHRGITIGLQHLMESKEVWMLVNGEKKAGIVQKALQLPVNNLIPGSVIRKHQNSRWIMDKQAASML